MGSQRGTPLCLKKQQSTKSPIREITLWEWRYCLLHLQARSSHYGWYSYGRTSFCKHLKKIVSCAPPLMKASLVKPDSHMPHFSRIIICLKHSELFFHVCFSVKLAFPSNDKGVWEATRSSHRRRIFLGEHAPRPPCIMACFTHYPSSRYGNLAGQVFSCFLWPCTIFHEH